MMPDGPTTPDTMTAMQQFGGLVLEIGPVALPPGAMVDQTNMTCERRGILETRSGLKPVTFNE